MTFRRLVLTAAAVLCVASRASAQTATTPLLDRAIKDVVQDVQDAKDKPVAPDVGNSLTDLLIVARPKGALPRLVRDFEQERSDEQIGAAAASSGTSTLVSKGAVPQVLAFAVENGVIAQSQSGTTVTFRGNLGGALRALGGKGFVQALPADDPAVGFLSRVSVSASFDTSRGGAAPAAAPASTTLTADRQQLSQWTWRAQLINHRDPAAPAFLATWQSSALDFQKKETMAAAAAYAVLKADPAFITWREETNTAVAVAKAEDLEAVVRRRFAAFPADRLRTDTAAALDGYDRAAADFAERSHDVLKQLERGALVTLEYTNDRPALGPTLSSLRLVAATGGAYDLTGNASVTLFDQVPAGASRRVRDVGFSGELDRKIGSMASGGPFVLSLSAKYQHQFENSFDMSGMMMPGTTGTTAVAQVKLMIPAGKDTGAKIPLSITWANRTDLAKEAVVRANIGITYDLDTILAKFKP